MSVMNNTGKWQNNSEYFIQMKRGEISPLFWFIRLRRGQAGEVTI